jgi:hypothetical protein
MQLFRNESALLNIPSTKLDKISSVLAMLLRAGSYVGSTEGERVCPTWPSVLRACHRRGSLHRQSLLVMHSKSCPSA